MKTTSLVVVLAVVSTPVLASADGIRFEGEIPNVPHFELKVTEAQRTELEQLRARPGGPQGLVLMLTPDQRLELQERSGVEVEWLFMWAPAELEAGCACGLLNAAVDRGDRLQVLTASLIPGLEPGTTLDFE
jgi:hypothetical protein